MTTDVVTVDIPGNRDDVLKILKRTGISGVPVIKDGNIVGIITRKDLLHKPEENQLALLMTPDPITILPTANLTEAARIMVDNNIRRLPVVDSQKKLAGLISVADLILAIARMKIEEEIKDRFTSPTFAIWEETPLPLVGRIMEISGFEAIPVLSKESKLQGILSERDLIRCAMIEDSVETSDLSTTGTDDDEWTWESIRDVHHVSYGISRVQLPNRPVREAMVTNVVMVPPNAEVSECALKMKRARVDQLPIINGDNRLKSILFDRVLIKVLLDEKYQ
jgi:CBS domain-containing protein